MDKENKIIIRIQNENITITKHGGRKDLFSYNYENKIVVPMEVDLNEDKNLYALAHELGHAHQFARSSFFKKSANVYCRGSMKDCIGMPSLLFSFFLLWFELDAWVKGFFILKEEKIPTKTFVRFAWECFKTYLKNEMKKAMLVILPSYPTVTLLGYFFNEEIDWSSFWWDSLMIYGISLLCYEICNIFFVACEAHDMKNQQTTSCEK